MTELARLVRELGRPTVVVFGDAMLDRYVFGGISRISPEAPIQILRVAREEERPGGAASVAHDLAVLGARVRLVAYAGDDEAGGALRRLMSGAKIDAKGLVETKGRPTTLKTRMVARGAAHSVSQQVLRRSALNTRPSRLGAAWVWRESVVTLNRRTVLGTMPALRMSFATVLRQQRSPWAINSACTRGAP